EACADPADTAERHASRWLSLSPSPASARACDSLFFRYDIDCGIAGARTRTTATRTSIHATKSPALPKRASPEPAPRVCCHFVASRVAARNGARSGVGGRYGPSPAAPCPCRVLQRLLAPLPAQPCGPGLFLRDAALLVAYLEQPNFASRALPRVKTGAGAAAHEMATDPRPLRR